MTSKQVERIKTKIKRIKAELAADKKHWGGYYHDGRGLRYLPPALYVQIVDYTGGLRYINWFRKHFPDDSAYAKFFFECAIILFKTKRLKEAERKIFKTFFTNTYVLDKFFERPIIPIEKYEMSYGEEPAYCEHFPYTHKQDELADFSKWLQEYQKSDKFISLSTKLVAIFKRLKNEKDSETRSYLINQAYSLKKDL